MNIQSMTGFGKGEATNDDYQVSVEIKSVNHRFKDIRFKMSSMFNAIELDLKKSLADLFGRGSFDIYVNYKRAEGRTRFDNIDQAKVDDFLANFSHTCEKHDARLVVSPSDLFRAEFMKDQDEGKADVLSPLVRAAFQGAVKSLKESREQEGMKLAAVLQDHLATYRTHFKVVEGLAATFQTSIEEKLRKRFSEVKSDMQIDEPRFMQEVVFYLEKMDVHEEINRIKSHLQKFDSLVADGGEAGRQIEFLLQELGRETNTIGSKSSIEAISNAVVQMKVQLEKIREQALNLE